ncbi:MAG: hypothetical protein NC340_10215 [Ruminococcus flavefaciens]|nr:hypothetical protein [Ruminococcus flavefaciens]MCM1230782.1 hypothetical protein [Ruminococcus flavefaciens]
MNKGYLKLLQSLDSLFPIGAFTLSNGMETYVQKNLVYDKNTLMEFIDSYMCILPYNDLGFSAKSAMGEDFIMLDLLCSISKAPSEIRHGSEKLCARFLSLENAMGDYPGLRKYAESIKSSQCIGHHSIATGLFIGDTETDLIQGLEMYCYSILSAMVNHAVKLVPLRQLDGQQCLNKAVDKIPQAVQKAINADISELGISGAGFDLRSMQHEKLYSRLYIS